MNPSNNTSGNQGKHFPNFSSKHTSTTERQPVPGSKSYDFSYDFNDAIFNSGYVSVTKKISLTDPPLQLKIFNAHLLPEFDSIKSWFSKKLGKRFRVQVIINYLDNLIVDTIATSWEIASINAELIDAITFDRTIELPGKIQRRNPEQSLFTAEDIFSGTGKKGDEQNVFNRLKKIFYMH